MNATNLTLCFPRSSSSSSSKSVLAVSSILTEQLQRNHIVVKVDRFGWSANNVTYQALGRHPHFRYYDFHPAPAAPSTSTSEPVSPQTHGVVPVWGFGTVVSSAHPKVIVGERLYGYFAPARYLVLPIAEKDVNKYSIYVPRSHLPADRRVYNQILRCSTDPLYSPETEDLAMLYRPLFWTSYWCEDWLARSQYRSGCEYILISSASSKTAFCLAYCVRKRVASGINIVIIGLTSKGNMEFTKKLGLYHEVYDYDSFLSTPGNVVLRCRWIYIDVAGNQALNTRIYTHFASPYTIPTLVAAVSLGMTNLAPGAANVKEIEWSTNTDLKAANTQSQSPQNSSVSSLGFWPVAEQFFLPEWLAVRRLQLSPTQIADMQKGAWEALMRDCIAWVEIEHVWGGERVKRAYEALIGNPRGVSPDKGLIWSMWDAEDANTRAKL
ncbi:hypothetical protein BDP27DRAFT_1265111 [Rhodocollybia butyracea]|uniref:DUF2855 family protein n=1 Tax=Rhodocollybia butyracea TaxID=206335 RepID=A0A9P5U6Y3_9AGAR|nr:hypothetical protein BDP27DRAFT_1265111 [Rhodocollybia butyracea]